MIWRSPWGHKKEAPRSWSQQQSHVSLPDCLPTSSPPTVTLLPWHSEWVQKPEISRKGCEGATVSMTSWHGSKSCSLSPLPLQTPVLLSASSSLVSPFLNFLVRLSAFRSGCLEVFTQAFPLWKESPNTQSKMPPLPSPPFSLLILLFPFIVLSTAPRVAYIS